MTAYTGRPTGLTSAIRAVNGLALAVAACLTLTLAPAACGDPSGPPLALEKPRLPDEPCKQPGVAHYASTADLVAAMDHVWIYEPMPLELRNHITAATRALDAADLATVERLALQAGYALTPVVLGERCAFTLAPAEAAQKGQATLVVAAAYDRDLVIEAPHVPEDHQSDAEAARLFDDVRARVLIVAGAHRCASPTPSGCHPNKACSGAHESAESDVSHAVTSAFQAMHLAYRTTPAAIIQLHTNHSQTLNGDIQVSNGTSAVIPGTYADAFYAALHVPGVDVRGCNDPASPPPKGAFCGETNAQGLASNGAEDACFGRASSAGGAAAHSFIHVEQSFTRMDDLASWEPIVAAALAAAVPIER